MNNVNLLVFMARLTGAAGYADWIFAEWQDLCPGYDTKSSDGETSVMLELRKMRCTPLFPSLPVDSVIQIRKILYPPILADRHKHEKRGWPFKCKWANLTPNYKEAPISPFLTDPHQRLTQLVSLDSKLNTLQWPPVWIQNYLSLNNLLIISFT